MPEPQYRVRRPVDPPIPDAPGFNLKPDLDVVATPAEFVEALRDLHSWAGEPSLRELARRCGHSPSRSTFGALLRSETLPKLDLVLAFVDALGLAADREQWRAAWRRLRMRAVK
jgi:hypothetical protein